MDIDELEDMMSAEVQKISPPCPCLHPRCTGSLFHIVVEPHPQRPVWASEYPDLIWQGINQSAKFQGISPWVMLSGSNEPARSARVVCWWALNYLGIKQIKIGEVFGVHPTTVGKGIREANDQLGLVDSAKLATLLR